MSRIHDVLRLLAATCCYAAMPGRANSQQIPVACQPLIDAERKVIVTPHHTYQTEGMPRPDGKAKTGESISTGGVSYLQMKGTWIRSPVTPKAELDRLNQNIARATAYSCAHVGDESVAGTAAAVYTAHTESEGVKADARIWLTKSSGLILHLEEDVDTGGGDKLHMSIRYEYTNVQAPAGVK